MWAAEGTSADLERLSSAGYRAFLIGERFMTDSDPARAIGDLIGEVRPKPDTTGVAWNVPASLFVATTANSGLASNTVTSPCSDVAYTFPPAATGDAEYPVPGSRSCQTCLPVAGSTHAAIPFSVT